MRAFKVDGFGGVLSNCLEKDIAKLADILGHSSVNTTRIYIMTNGHPEKRIRTNPFPLIFSKWLQKASLCCCFMKQFVFWELWDTF